MKRAGKHLEHLHLALLGALAFGFTFKKMGEYDFWWHLSLGRTVAETGSPNPSDTLSYTFFGSEQFGEWLGDLLIYLSVDLFGLPGANLLLFSVLALTLFFLYKTLQVIAPEDSRTWHYTCILTLVIVLFAIRFRLFVRPFMFTYLFIALFLFILLKYRENRQQALLWILPLAAMVWANMSRGAFFGPVLVGIFTLDHFLRNRKDWRPGMCLAAVSAASLISPEGFVLYSSLLKFSLQGSEAAVVGEHQPLSVPLLWGFGWHYTLGFQILVVLSAMFLVLLRGWRDTFRLLLVIAFFLPALWMIRMVDFFALVATICAAPALHRLITPVTSRLLCRNRLLDLSFAGILVAIFLVSVPWNRIYAFGSGVKEGTFPQGALEFVREQGVGGRLFNSYPFGGYLSWYAPERKVFIDGRINVLYPPPFHKAYEEMMVSPEAWEQMDQKWGFDYAILEYDLRNRKHFPLHLTENPEWALVYWDEISAVYLKRTDENAQVIANKEYRVARPSFNKFGYLDEELRKGEASFLLNELEREISLNPLNQEVRLLKVFFLYKNNFRHYFDAQILSELEKCLELKPDLAFEHSAMAMILLDANRMSEALEHAEKALSIDPADPAAIAVMGRLGIQVETASARSPH